MIADPREALCLEQFPLPNGWHWSWLGEVMEIQGGAQPPASTFLNHPAPGYVRFVQIRDFDGDDHLTFIRQSPKWRTCAKDDVLIARYGVSLGRILRGLEGAYNVALAKAVPRADVTREFLYYLLKSTFFQAPIQGLGARSVQSGFNRKDLRVIPVPIPARCDQEAISGLLGTLDAKIALNSRMNETLEAIAQVIFKSWFIDSARTHDLSKRSEASELREIPDGWRTGSLAELMDIQGGTQPPASEFLSKAQDGYVRLIQIRDYESNAHLTFVPDTHKLRKCEREDVMIARYGASVARVCWGLVGAYNVALVKAMPLKPFHREYLRSYLRTDDFQTRLIRMSNRSVQAGFNKGDIASFRILIPPDEVFEAYETIAWALRSRVLHNIHESRTLADLRDTLLPRLLSGALRFLGTS